MPASSLPFQSCRPIFQENAVTWRVWAPRAENVELVLSRSSSEERIAMNAEENGFYTMTLPDHHSGERYGYSLNGGPVRPDPATVSQPEGVHQMSALFSPADYSWKHPAPEIQRSDLILYELHIGTFTPEGTFAAALQRLPDLVELGINAIEILPVAQFPGGRNWGYDGVHPMATQHSYGGPEAFQRFIDEAHSHGLAVFLDVVFNHLGPEGNYLNEFAPYFTERYPTPWGPAFNFDGRNSRPVRDWALECTWQWIHDFRLDGLRLDAVHAMHDASPKHILTEIKETADTAARERGGTAIIIAESLLNDATIVTSTDQGGLGLDAEWNEDFHHAVSAWMTDEEHGKYVDYRGIETLATVMRNTFHLTGQHSEFYGQTWGRPAHDLPTDRFVISLHNHDHIGNRARGDRLASLVSSKQLRLGACLTLLSPFIPMLFMGEEYGETNPFLFVCAVGDRQLSEGVRRGRKRDYGLRGNIPDPQAETSFRDSVVSWDWNDLERARLRELYRELTQLRKSHSGLRDGSNRGEVELAGAPGRELLLIERDEIRCCFNLGPEPNPLPAGKVIWRSEEESNRLAPFETALIKPET